MLSDQFVKRFLIDIHQPIVFWKVRWRKTTVVFSEVQMKVIAAVAGGLPGEALKDHIRAQQLKNTVHLGPPYFEISDKK